MTCWQQNLQIFEYTPLQIKQTVTGDGRADKKAMRKMIELQLTLPHQIKTDDAIDALGVCLTHAILRNHRQ